MLILRLGRLKIGLSTSWWCPASKVYSGSFCGIVRVFNLNKYGRSYQSSLPVEDIQSNQAITFIAIKIINLSVNVLFYNW